MDFQHKKNYIKDLYHMAILIQNEKFSKTIIHIRHNKNHTVKLKV